MTVCYHMTQLKISIPTSPKLFVIDLNDHSCKAIRLWMATTIIWLRSYNSLNELLLFYIININNYQTMKSA